MEENKIDDADRGMPSITRNKRKGGGVIEKLFLVCGGVILILALIAVNGGFSSGENEEIQQKVSNDKIGNRLGPAPEPPKPPKIEQVVKEEPVAPKIIQTNKIIPTPPPEPIYPKRYAAKEKSKEISPYERKTNSGLLAYGKAERSSSKDSDKSDASSRKNNNISSLAGEEEAERADGLSAALKPTKVEGARAGFIEDRNMFITKGTFLDCALETAISSDVAGMTSCRLTRDVYSTSGKVLLLERGSRIVGQYQGGLQRGKARIFVLWSRVETPTGVIVDIDSPGTDALGRSGHTGHIDTHFWERFGGAIMLSLIDDVGNWVANEALARRNGNSQIQFGGTADTASNSAGIALENSINIRPTLTKNQGDHISIFVGRDLDFRGVYELALQ